MELAFLGFWILASLISGLIGTALVLELWNSNPLKPEARSLSVVEVSRAKRRSSLRKHLQAVSVVSHASLSEKKPKSFNQFYYR